jgi:hypothetical protein
MSTVQALKDVKAYAKKNKVEVNFDKDGISLWATVDRSDFVISHISADEVEEAVTMLVNFRRSPWKSN